MSVMISSFVIMTSSSHGGSPLRKSLIVGVRVHALLSTPHELINKYKVELPYLLFAPLCSPFNCLPNVGPIEAKKVLLDRSSGVEGKCG